MYAGQGPVSTTPTTAVHGPPALPQIEDILQRLQNLEQAVFKKTASAQTDSHGPPTLPSSMALVRHGAITVTQPETQDPDEIGNDDTSRWLEGIATTPNSVLSLPTHAVSFSMLLFSTSIFSRSLSTSSSSDYYEHE